MSKPISQGNVASPLSGIPADDGHREAAALGRSMSTDHGNDQPVQACTAPTPWLGFLIALLLVAGAALVFLFFKP